MSNKLYSVKGFTWEEKKDTIIPNKDKRLRLNVQKMIVLATNLTWEKAKEFARSNKSYGAIIFPNNIKSELKVITL